MMRIALDTDAINSLLSRKLWKEISAAAKRRGVVFVIVHVVKDQLAQTKDGERRAQLMDVYAALPKIEVPTSGFALDISRLGCAEMQGPAHLDGFTTKGRGKMQDALIAATAAAKADVFVTDDTRLMNRVKAKTSRCEVWKFEQLIRFFRDQHTSEHRTRRRNKL